MRPVSSALFGLAAAGCSAASGAGHRRRQDPSASVAPTPTTSVFVLPSATSAPNVNASEYDLSRHYCRLWRHASGYSYVSPSSTLFRPHVVTVLPHQCILTSPPITGVVADGKIYVDGGETYVPKNNGNFNTTPEGEFTKGISSCSPPPPPLPHGVADFPEITIFSSLTSPKISLLPTRDHTRASSKAPRSPRR